MRLHELRGAPDADLTHEIWCRGIARVLRAASAALTRAAWVLEGRRRPRRRAPPALEFYAEAGAPEGALYADGERVGTLPRVPRL